MLDYVFFDPLPCERFIEFLRERGLEPICREETRGAWEVALPEDLDEALAERIEAFYDEMMELNQALFEAGETAAAAGYHAAGVVLNLRSGQTVYAEVDPGLLGRVMSVVTPQEFGEIVDAIVAAVEQPDGRTFCQRMRGEPER
ncbi:MAG: hypothetical protein P8106_04210 [Gammaproteobacteria bacterium]|jgi:hypothetical protein